MTNDDIIRMAHEAGLEDWTVHGRIEDKWVCLKKFAALVIAAERRTALLEAAEMIRDACEYTDWNENGQSLAERIEAAARNR